MRYRNGPLSVFISYSHKDENLREELEEHLSSLRREGRVDAWHDRKITPGGEWQERIDDHLEAAELILLLISSAFLASDYCWDVEMNRALARHDAGEARVLPILLRPCDWQSARFAKLQVLPTDAKPVTAWPDPDEAFLDVVRGIRAAVGERADRQSDAEDRSACLRPGPYGLPRPPGDSFLGRHGDLERLHQLLVPSPAVGLTPLVAASGGGGIGKTRLAIEYAWRHRDAYPGGIFFTNVGERSPLEVWAELAGQLFPRPFSKVSAAADAIYTHLKTAEGGRVLVIFDDLAGDGGRFTRRLQIDGRPVNALPASERLSVLITTRLGDLPGVESVPVTRLDREAAFKLLLERGARPPAGLGPEELAEAEDLADRDLGGHALAVALAGAYLRKVPSVKFSSYRAKLRQRGLTAALEEAGRHAGHTVTDYELSIAATFRLSHALVAGREPENLLARQLLDLVAFLAPGVAMDRRLLRLLLRQGGSEATDEDVDLAITRLLDISLLSPAHEADAAARADVQIHALVGDYVRWSQEAPVNERCLEAVLAAIRELFPENWFDFWKILIPRGRAGWEPLTTSREAHASAALEHEESNGFPDGAVVGLSVGHVRRERGDLPGALMAYRRAQEICSRLVQTAPLESGREHDLALSHRWIGDVLRTQGDLPGTLKQYRMYFETTQRLSAQNPDNVSWRRELSVSHEKVGDVLREQGDLSGALEQFQASFEIAKRLSAQNPDNTDWLRSLVLSRINVGDVLKVQGDLSGALEHYRASLKMAQRLSAQDLDNAGWRRELSISHARVGDGLKEKGNLSDALEQFQASFEIAQGLSAQDPDNAGWRRDLSLSHGIIGDVLKGQGDLSGALEQFRASFEIARDLSAQDPDNAGWRRDLSLSHLRIGDAMKEQGNLSGTLEHFRVSFGIARDLSARDRGNASWRRDLSVSHEKVGDVLKELGDLPGALEQFRASFEICRSLSDQDPDNTGWRRDLSVSHERIGDVLKEQGDLSGAMEQFRASFEICQGLAAQDPENAGWRRNLSVSYGRVGDALKELGDVSGALKKFRTYFEISQGLSIQDPDNVLWQIDVATSCWCVAHAIDTSTHRGTAEAVTLLEQALEIFQRLAVAGRLSIRWRHWIPNYRDALRRFVEARSSVEPSETTTHPKSRISKRGGTSNLGDSQGSKTGMQIAALLHGKGESDSGLGEDQGSKTGMGIAGPMNAYALLIGVGQSKYSNWSLPVTVRDVAELRKILVDRNFCAYPDDPHRIRVLTDENATRYNILAAVDDLARAAAVDLDATFLVYYSGHGWRRHVGEAGERYFLVPHDVRPHELIESALPADDFIRGLQSVRSERLLVMIDTCHAEAMADAKDPAGPSIPKSFVEEPLPKALAEELGTGRGRAVFVSCGGDQKSWILPGDDSLSIFTHHLLAALKGAGNAPGDKVVKVSDLMSHLGEEVRKSAHEMGREQTPVFKLAAEDFPVALIQGGKGLTVAGDGEPSRVRTKQSDQKSDVSVGKVRAERDAVVIHTAETVILGGASDKLTDGSPTVKIDQVKSGRDTFVTNEIGSLRTGDSGR